MQTTGSALTSPPAHQSDLARRPKGGRPNAQATRRRSDTGLVTSYTPEWRPVETAGVNEPQRSDLFNADGSVEPDVDGQFIKVVGFWAPRRWVTRETMDVDGLVAEIEEIVRTRGLVAYDGQVITSLRLVREWEEYFEAGANTQRDIPRRCHWGPEQRAFFGIEQPYQMSDDEGPFTNSSVAVEIADPFLDPGELIAGVIHGSRERCFFTCPCHYANVVYTTRHRLVCMSCGATHLVLREPVLTTFRQTIAPEEWGELFGAEGSRHHESLDLAVVDVQDIEGAAPFVWSTNQWDEGRSRCPYSPHLPTSCLRRWQQLRAMTRKPLWTTPSAARSPTPCAAGAVTASRCTDSCRPLSGPG